MSDSDCGRACRFKDIRCTRFPRPMPESRLEEPLFCLDMDAEVRIKGCGTTCDVTEARADIQS